MDRRHRRGRAGVPALLAAVLAAAPNALGQPATPVSAESAKKLIEQVGRQKAAEQILSDSPTLEAVAANVAGGRPEWLDVGAQLVGVAESYLKDRLVQSFSVALEREPSAVLVRGASGVPLAEVCSYDPFSAAEAPPTRAEFHGAVAARERALAGVKRADLATAKGACLDAVARLKAAGPKPY